MTRYTQAKLGYSVNEATQLAPISRAKFYRLMKLGMLRYTQVGGKRIIPHQALVDLIEGNK